MNHQRKQELTLMAAVERLSISDFNHLSRKLPGFKTSISTASSHIYSIGEGQDFLQSLWFDNLTSRERRVLPTYAKTFDWALRRTSSDGVKTVGFAEWLLEDNGIFWIRGKAGSGKSTLMKHLSHHSMTRDYLEKWSGSKTLVLASFYFWSSGTYFQKSREGLLRSLIFEIIRQCPVLIQYALTASSELARIWETKEVGASSRTWTEDKLLRLLEQLVGHSTPKRFCFFIDGLDEYKSRHTEDTRDLISALTKLASSPDTKICLSSRPWTVFVDAFGGDERQYLKLEDFTRQDIRTFVVGKFSEHGQYHKLGQFNPKYRELVDEVVTRSKGVFLWVFLVVRKLLERFTYNDGIKTMHRRLESIPDSLEDYFQHMLDSVPKFYLKTRTRIFQIALSINYALPMILYSFVGDLEDEPELAYQEIRQPCDEHERLWRRGTIERRLDACCKGLLEVVGSRVDFLHRTVRDFLLAGDVKGVSNEDPYDRTQNWLLVCQAIELRFKRCIDGEFQHTMFLPDPKPGGGHDSNATMEELSYFCKKALNEGADSGTVFEILSSALNAASTVKSLSTMNIHNEFLGPACQNGLLEYIQLRLSSSSSNPIKLSPEQLERLVCCVMEPSPISNEFHPEIFFYLINYTENLGYHSKDLYAETFTRFICSIGEGHGRLSPRTKNIPNLVRAIASTGFPMYKEFLRHFPQYYAEVMKRAIGTGGNKRPRDDTEDGKRRNRLRVFGP